MRRRRNDRDHCGRIHVESFGAEDGCSNSVMDEKFSEFLKDVRDFSTGLLDIKVISIVFFFFFFLSLIYVLLARTSLQDPLCTLVRFVKERLATYNRGILLIS